MRRASLLIMALAEAELQELRPRDLRKIMGTMTFLRDFPFAAQSAELPDAPEVRRAVSGNYLIYYLYDAQRHAIRVYSVRSGWEKPPTAQDLGLH